MIAGTDNIIKPGLANWPISKVHVVNTTISAHIGNSQVVETVVDLNQLMKRKYTWIFFVSVVHLTTIYAVWQVKTPMGPWHMDCYLV